jgi:CO/xanthine dehydrogenase Mo-binding subunit
MQAAEVLGLTPEQIKPSVGDTDSIGYTQTSAGSRTTVATGIAVVRAAEDVIARMSARAALLWNVPVDKVTFHQGVFAAGQDSDRRLSFAELSAQLNQTGGPVTGVGNVDVQDWGASFGTHIVDVEVDPETGQVTILRYTAVQDAGKAIHPGHVEGQMVGGAVQGIGLALYEGYVYDQEGQLLNPTFLDYKLPTALDAPPIEAVIVEVPYPNHPFGARGVGETPIVPPPAAIANAICRATGARMDQLPMTPAHILERMGVI